MICPFCAQRNPRGTRRCLFCDNPPDATDDASAVWPPRGRRNQELPGQVQEGHISRVRQAYKEESKRQHRIESFIAVGVFGFIILGVLIQYLFCGG